MAGATTLPTSPNAAAPPQKDESGAQAAEAAHGGCLPSQWPADESACASGASCEPMSGQDLRVGALAEDGAARAVYAAILLDMSPPWLLHSFPQALPGNGVLSKCTRPCFLTWGVDLSRLVLGPQVLSELTRIVASVGLPLSGVVARPLYVCTGSVSDGMCMATASMSPILLTGVGRGEFLRRKCAGCIWRAHAPNSVRLRVLS